MPKINELISSQSKRNPKQQFIKNFSYASIDSKNNYSTDPTNTLNINNTEVFQRNHKKPSTLTCKLNLFGSKKLSPKFTVENTNDLIVKLRQENSHLQQIIISKDKELENLNAINNQIIKGQESKNDVNYNIIIKGHKRLF